MAEPSKILLVEDVERDAELVLHELKLAGLVCESRRVQTESDFRRELKEFRPHLIVSDFAMPRFSGREALKIARESDAEIPLIFVSGTIGEDVAVEAMKAGANDYVMKTNPARLGPAVQRELREAEGRRGRKLAEAALRESEIKYRELIEQASDGIFVADTRGNFILVNSRYCEMLGYGEEELLRLNGSETYPEEERGSYADGIAQLKDIKNRLFERMMRRKDGSCFPVEMSVRLLGNGTHQCIVRDITERKKAQDKIARLTRVYAVLSGINALIVRARDKDELFREACRIAVEDGKFQFAWLGVVDRKAMEIVPVARAGNETGFLDTMQARRSLKKTPAQGHGPAARAVLDKRAAFINDVTSDPRIVRKAEHLERGIRSVGMLPLVVSDEAVGVLALHAPEAGFFDDKERKLLLDLAGDISFALEHIEKEEKLKYLAYYDSLTGLANRDLLHERLTQSVRFAGRDQRKLALIMMDIERFKAINDSFGRHAGDALLKQFAASLSGAVGDPTRLARVGGDQFIAVLRDLRAEGDVARFYDQRLRECFGQPFSIEGNELRISAKAGIAIFPNDGVDAEALFLNAEAALKRAKATGERFMFFNQQMSEKVGEKLKLETKLRQALEKEEFVLHYQPKVDTETRRIVGVEALIRWRSPELGLVPPMQFIPLLEETGLIFEVGAWALRQAASDYRRWKKLGLAAPRVAVNVSSFQLRRRDFVESVQNVLGEGASAAAIDLELTESLIMEDVRASTEKLEALRVLGVELAIDDFGTGYSSLTYLAKLPVQTLKIDRSFIITMLKDPAVMTLVSTIISMAHSLRLKVVAEGVDAEEQASALRRLGCDQMQGYLFSKPVEFDAITVLIGNPR